MATAVCVTGAPRSLFLRFPHEVKPPNPSQSSLPIWHNHDWAGPMDPSFPSWLEPSMAVARSIVNNVLRVLASSGGYDLFVVEPGDRHDSRWELFRLPAASSNVSENRVFVRLGGGEPELPYNRSSAAFQRFYYVAKQYPRPDDFIQQMLWQYRHLQMCNEAVEASGVAYAYKMRLRPDLAWVAPIPPLDSLNLGKHSVHFSSLKVPDHYGVHEDSFAVGRTRAMDTYFRLYDGLAAGQIAARDGGELCHRCIWTAEAAVVGAMRRERIELAQDRAFRATLVRAADYVQGKRPQLTSGGGAAGTTPRAFTRHGSMTARLPEGWFAL